MCWCHAQCQHAHTHTLSLSHTHTHSLTHTHSHSLTLTHLSINLSHAGTLTYDEFSKGLERLGVTSEKLQQVVLDTIPLFEIRDVQRVTFDLQVPQPGILLSTFLLALVYTLIRSGVRTVAYTSK
jgi:hypothetical protein